MVRRGRGAAVGEAPTEAAIVAVVGSMSADMVANIPLGCLRNGDVNRPPGPDGQQQLAGRYTLAWNGGGLISDGNRRSDSVLTDGILNYGKVIKQ
jgi:hypothetical protein